MHDDSPLLELADISKRYGGVQALAHVDFAARRGSIHAIVGENGAGKTTLIKSIAGVVKPDTGTMRLFGREAAFTSPQQANRAGVVCIFQELSLIPDLSVADNICITTPPRRFGLIDGRAQRRRATELLARVGCEDIDPSVHVRNLPLSRRQMVEIAKALGRDPKLLILDEATSALSAADVERVYRILHGLRDAGLCLLYISHRMREIEELADTCSVFRNGRHIETFAKASRTYDDIVRMMIGRDIRAVFPPKPAPRPRPPALEVENLSWTDRLHNLSLHVNRGELVGIGGLDGQGQRELLLALFGVLRGVSGKITIEGQHRRIRSPAGAKAAGIALIPEDRKTEGLLLPLSVAENMTIAALGRFGSPFAIDQAAEAKGVDAMIARLRILLGERTDPVATLSGGNQQKVVIAKWLLTGTSILLLNDPTRGIDVGTKQEMYALLRELADGGTSILFYSTDYNELIGCCDRVLVFYDGRIVRTLAGAELTETNMIASALNLSPRTEATAPHSGERASA
jgi:ribose transport system ATP-binding protein